MSVEALLELRDDVATMLVAKTKELRSQLAALGEDEALRGGRRAGSRKGIKVAPKYRNPKNPSETWAGRGAMPRWMAAAIKAGKKQDSFLIDKSAAKSKRASARKTKRRGRPAQKRQSAAASNGNGTVTPPGENA